MKPSARHGRTPRWEAVKSKRTVAVQRHLRALIIKVSTKRRGDDHHIEVDDDERALLDKILVMIWKGEDTRTLLFKPMSGRSRPDNSERDLAIARAYAAALMNNEIHGIRKTNKTIRSEIVASNSFKNLKLSDSRVKSICEAHSRFIDSLRTI